MYALIDQWQQSGLKQKDFCQQHNVPYYTFKYYRTQKTQEENVDSPQASFIRVKVGQPKEIKGLTIIYPNGVRLYFEGAVDPEQIKNLIQIY